MKNTLTRPAAGLLASLLAWPVMGQNLYFLKDTPLAKFQGEDASIFQGTLQETLDQAADGETRRWSNPATGSAGTVTPELTLNQNQTLCRRAKIANTAGGISREGIYLFCKGTDGSWDLSGQ